MGTYNNLKVWQKSHSFTLELYRLTKSFPRDERFGLIQQIRRAAISIPANIAEGSKRHSDRDYAHFLNISQGSLEEAKYYLLLSKDLSYISENEFNRLFILSEEIGKLLNGFIKKLIA